MTTKLNPILLFVIIVASLYNCQGKDQNTSHGNHSCSNYSIEQNKKIVIDFYQQMFGDKDISAVDKYIAPDYIQHNPNVADGAEAFKKTAAKWFEGKPKTKVDIQHIAAEGDLVFIHIKISDLMGD
ncbi:nuclear transport factor 2 family protein [Chryseobacterium gossypii]|uniref:nuclear transport factor 2 family protein n=1 Tax=Chryseobacterium gossypii TaxID=3231602 RepID=UPI0035258E45